MIVNITIKGTCKEITDLVSEVHGRLRGSVVDEAADSRMDSFVEELLTQRTPYSNASAKANPVL